MSKRKTCFFVTPIGGENSPQRNRADKVKKHILHPVLSNELDIVRADDVDETGDISQDIIVRLHRSDLVVADLTGQNPNVMYEVGIRHCFNRPLVSLVENASEIPFDIAMERAILYDIADLDSVEATKARLDRSVKKAIAHQNYKSPVVRALELQDLIINSFNEPISRSVLELLEDVSTGIDDIQAEVSSVQFNIDMQQTEHTAYLDPRTDEQISEIARLFAQVSPSDIADLVRRLKD